MKKFSVTVLLNNHENIADEGIALLKDNNYQIYFAGSTEEILDYATYRFSEVLLVRGAAVDRELMTGMPNLRIIARSGVGIDNIDIKGAADYGIQVSNVPDANYVSVAEHVIGMLISLSHQIIKGDRAIRRGEFDARYRYTGTELSGKTLGIIGMGRIGRLVAEKCTQGLSMQVLGYDPYIKDIHMENVHLVDNMEEVFVNADFITLHLPYTVELHHFVDEAIFKKMKKTAYIINCARGGLIDENTLVEAIDNAEIAGAGLDVFENEPIDIEAPLLKKDNIIATPHMGASTHESLERMSVGAAKEIIRILEECKEHSLVND